MNEFQVILIVLVVSAFISMLIAGANNQIVIFFDKKDFLVSLIPWGVILLGLMLVNTYEDRGSLDFKHLSVKQSLILYTSILLSVISLIWSIHLSIYHNRSITLGVLVGIFKVLSSLLATITLIAQIQKIFSDKSTTKDVLVAMLILGVFVWLGKKLINGEQVYLAKGWDLPGRASA